MSASNTITVTRKTTTSQSVSLPVPFFAAYDNSFYAITGADNNVYLMFGHMGNLLLVQSNMTVSSLPENYEQISEESFLQQWEKAMLQLTEQVHAACPSLPVPEATLQTA